MFPPGNDRQSGRRQVRPPSQNGTQALGVIGGANDPDRSFAGMDSRIFRLRAPWNLAAPQLLRRHRSGALTSFRATVGLQRLTRALPRIVVAGELTATDGGRVRAPRRCSLVVCGRRAAGRLLTRGVALGEPGGVLERRGRFDEDRRLRGSEALSDSLAFARAPAIRACQLECVGEAGPERRRLGAQLARVLAQGTGAAA